MLLDCKIGFEATRHAGLRNYKLNQLQSCSMQARSLPTAAGPRPLPSACCRSLGCPPLLCLLQLQNLCTRRPGSRWLQAIKHSQKGT